MNRLFLGIAVLVVAGCSHPAEVSNSLPVHANTEADKERLIRENTQLTPAQKELELAKLKAMNPGK